LKPTSRKPWLDVLVHLVICGALLSVVPFLLSFFPKPAFEDVLKRDYPGEVALAISGKTKVLGERRTSRGTYVLLPSVFYDPKFVSIAQKNEEAPTVVEQRGLFLLSLAVFLVLSGVYFHRRWQARSGDD
jgi:hypothetical protein